MLILLYGVNGEAAFDTLRVRSQTMNVKLRPLAEQLVSDYRALGNEDALPPRSVYEHTLMTVHQRITRDRSDSPYWKAPKRFGTSRPGNREVGGWMVTSKPRRRANPGAALTLKPQRSRVGRLSRSLLASARGPKPPPAARVQALINDWNGHN
jgi:hypothetical protein